MKNKLFFSAMLASLLAFGLIFTSCAARKAALEATEAIKSAPSIKAVNGLKNKLIWLQSNAESGGTYVVEIYYDKVVDQPGGLFEEPYNGYLSYKDRSDITIILKGVVTAGGGASPTISMFNPGALFAVGSGVTLVLDNITLKGTSAVAAYNQISTSALVGVGGTLIMNEGSTITNNMNLRGNGGGVYVGDGGTFIMKGGTITGNTCFPVPNAALMAATKGKANAFREEHYKGGGVYVSGKGTFTKTGGIITGYASDPKNGNVVKGFAGEKIAQNSGHAVYFDGSKEESKSIDKTIGPEMSFHFSNGKFGDVPKEEPESEKNTDEPEDNLSSDGSETSAAPTEPTPTPPPIANCATETNKAKAIFNKCKEIGKGKSGYDECGKEYSVQRARAQQACLPR